MTHKKLSLPENECVSPVGFCLHGGSGHIAGMRFGTAQTAAAPTNLQLRDGLEAAKKGAPALAPVASALHQSSEGATASATATPTADSTELAPYNVDSAPGAAS